MSERSGERSKELNVMVANKINRVLNKLGAEIKDISNKEIIVGVVEPNKANIVFDIKYHDTTRKKESAEEVSLMVLKFLHDAGHLNVRI